MKNLRMIAVGISTLMLLIVLGCKKEIVEPDHNALTSMDNSLTLGDSEPEHPNQTDEGFPCDSLCCCDGFELPEGPNN